MIGMHNYSLPLYCFKEGLYDTPVSAYRTAPLKAIIRNHCDLSVLNPASLFPRPNACNSSPQS